MRYWISQRQYLNVARNRATKCLRNLHTAKFLDNKTIASLNFYCRGVSDKQKKNSVFLDDFPLCPHDPPSKKRKFCFYIVISPSSESVSTGVWCVPGFGAGFEIALEPSELQKEGNFLEKGHFYFLRQTLVCTNPWFKRDLTSLSLCKTQSQALSAQHNGCRNATQFLITKPSTR